jgi:hypothetical protein
VEKKVGEAVGALGEMVLKAWHVGTPRGGVFGGTDHWVLLLTSMSFVKLSAARAAAIEKEAAVEGSAAVALPLEKERWPFDDHEGLEVSDVVALPPGAPGAGLTVKIKKTTQSTSMFGGKSESSEASQVGPLMPSVPEGCTQKAAAEEALLKEMKGAFQSVHRRFLTTPDDITTREE